MNRIAGHAIRLGRVLEEPPRTRTGPAALFSGAFASGFLTTMRPYLLFISGITGLLGMSLVPGLGAGSALVLGVVFFLAYGFGQALTDCFQTDTDAISAPYRPLVRGEIDKRHVLGLSLGALLVSGWILLAYHPLNLPLALLEIGGLVTYTWMKRRWWGGPPHNAWIVAVLVVMGTVSAAGAAGVAAPVDARLVWAALVAFFGYGAFVIGGYHKDIEADRATGYRTIPVRFGWAVSATVTDGFILGACVAVTGLVLSVDALSPAGRIGAVVFGAAGATAFLIARTRLHALREDREAHRAIAPIVHAYLLVASAGIAANRPDWIPALVLFYGLFVVTLRARPARHQV